MIPTALCTAYPDCLKGSPGRVTGAVPGDRVPDARSSPDRAGGRQGGVELNGIGVYAAALVLPILAPAHALAAQARGGVHPHVADKTAWPVATGVFRESTPMLNFPDGVWNNGEG